MSVVADKLPLLRMLPKRDWWILEEEFEYLDHLIPKGFITDLDTVYRVPFVYAIFKGKARIAALLHDWLYTTGYLTRKEADILLRDIAILEGNPKWVAHCMYIAVRLMGRSRYLKFDEANNFLDRLAIKQEVYKECR